MMIVRGMRGMLLAGAAGMAVAMMASAPAEAQVRRVPAKVAKKPTKAPVVAWANIVGYDSYEWIDRADAVSDAIGESPPDFSFAYDRGQPWAWTLDDGSVLIIEQRLDGPHSYYFEGGSATPFLVRDPQMSFGFIAARVAVVYDADGNVQDRRDAAPFVAAGQKGLQRGKLLKAAMLKRGSQRNINVTAWIDLSYLLYDWQRDWDQGRRRNINWRRHHDGPRGQEHRNRWDGERERRDLIREGFNRWADGGFRGRAPGRFTPPPPGTVPPQRPGRQGDWRDGRGSGRDGRDVRDRDARDRRDDEFFRNGVGGDLSVNPVGGGGQRGQGTQQQPLPQQNGGQYQQGSGQYQQGGTQQGTGRPMPRPGSPGSGYRPRPEPQAPAVTYPGTPTVTYPAPAPSDAGVNRPGRPPRGDAPGTGTPRQTPPAPGVSQPGGPIVSSPAPVNRPVRQPRPEPAPMPAPVPVPEPVTAQPAPTPPPVSRPVRQPRPEPAPVAMPAPEPVPEVPQVVILPDPTPAPPRAIDRPARERPMVRVREPEPGTDDSPRQINTRPAPQPLRYEAPAPQRVETYVAPAPAPEPVYTPPPPPEPVQTYAPPPPPPEPVYTAPPPPPVQTYSPPPPPPVQTYTAPPPPPAPAPSYSPPPPPPPPPASTPAPAPARSDDSPLRSDD